MNIEELAKRKVELQMTLQAIQEKNVYGKDIGQLTQLELHRIRTIKELNEVEGKIGEYTQPPAQGKEE